MREQLEQNTNEVNESFLRQRKEDKIIPESWVIGEAQTRGVISNTVASQLRGLYARRNKCIHRYIISDINYDDATQLVFDYAAAINSVGTIVNALESEQLERGIGIVAAEADTAEEGYESGIRSWFQELAIAKERRRNDEG